MNEILLQALQQWGTAGIIAAAAGYVLYDSWKRNKEIEKWLRDQFKASTESRQVSNQNLETLNLNIERLREDYEEFRTEIRTEVGRVESKINEHLTKCAASGSIHLNAISQIAPAVHNIINDGLDSCNCDHIAVALLHNGSAALSGIPYIKFGFVAEKYRPLENPNDIDLLSHYKDEDITSHNRLPSCIVQYPRVVFDVEANGTLAEIDPVVNNRCLKRGIKKIAFEAIRDVHGNTTGFVLIYKFNNDDFDIDALHSTTTTIEHLYQNLVDNLKNG